MRHSRDLPTLLEINGLEIRGIVPPVVSRLTYHCQLRPLGPVLAVNSSTTVSPPMEIVTRIPELQCEAKLKFPSMGPGAEWVIDRSGLPRPIAALQHIAEPTQVRFVVGVVSTESRQCEHAMWALPNSVWPCDGSELRTVPSLVNPRNPVVERIVLKACDELARITNVRSFVDLLKRIGPDAPHLAAHALYSCISNFEIHYGIPNFISLPDSLVGYQQLRYPPAQLDSGEPWEATCLDLSIALAACLEKIGLKPLLVFQFDAAGRPGHVACGCWTGSASGARQTVGSEELQSEIDHGNIFLIESTGMVRGAQRLSFDESLKDAVHQLRGTSVSAVDIGASRPPVGQITPVESPFDDVSAAIIERATQFAMDRRLESVEVTHLLEGLLAVPNRVTSCLIQQFNLSRESMMRCVSHLYPAASHREPPKPTLNYQECLRLAQQLAWDTGTNVGASELWHALINKARHSGNLHTVLSKVGVKIRAAQAWLEQNYPNSTTVYESKQYFRP